MCHTKRRCSCWTLVTWVSRKFGGVSEQGLPQNWWFCCWSSFKPTKQAGFHLPKKGEVTSPLSGNLKKLGRRSPPFGESIGCGFFEGLRISPSPAHRAFSKRVLSLEILTSFFLTSASDERVTSWGLGQFGVKPKACLLCLPTQETRSGDPCCPLTRTNGQRASKGIGTPE